MAAYIIAQLTVHDPSWVKEYGNVVGPLVAEHGGRYLVSSPKTAQLEGTSAVPTVTAILEFPDLESAQAFYDSDAYKPQLEARLAGATGDLWLVPGV